MNNKQRALLYSNWGIYSLSGLIWAFFISWIVLASVSFAYPILHDVLDISSHTEKFGPQNRYRKHFELTDQNERERLFSAISTAIHNDGEGLAELIYHNRNTGEPINTLLHRAEILHLEDVAKLVNIFTWVSVFSFLLWGLLLYAFKKHYFPMPTFKQQIVSTLMIIAVCTLLVLIIGPVKVFYAFHDWIFPANHKWFFYYQESLMTILMKAPFLFGYIAILLLALTIPIFSCSQLAAHRWVLRYNSAQINPHHKAS